MEHHTLVNLILIFLGTALLAYVLFGGADFGAGILELFLGRTQRKEQRDIIAHAMAPVWEANHVWLILAVVILFMGFPKVYTLVSIHLHVPLIAVLIGIVARGCAFTFRYYDAPNRANDRLYSLTFAFSSVWTPFFLGVTAGAMMLGRINPAAPDFRSAYVEPWCNIFCAALGLFTCALFALLAAVYLVGEANTGELRLVFARKAKVAAAAAMVCGALVFLAAELNGLDLIRAFSGDRVCQLSFVSATALWIPFWRVLKLPRHTLLARTLAAAIVALVLFGWYAVRFPSAISLQEAGAEIELTFYSAAAPAAVLYALLMALIAGVLLIFPALFYLLRVFKWETITGGGNPQGPPL